VGEEETVAEVVLAHDFSAGTLPQDLSSDVNHGARHEMSAPSAAPQVTRSRREICWISCRRRSRGSGA